MMHFSRGGGVGQLVWIIPLAVLAGGLAVLSTQIGIAGPVAWLGCIAALLLGVLLFVDWAGYLWANLQEQRNRSLPHILSMQIKLEQLRTIQTLNADQIGLAAEQGLNVLMAEDRYGDLVKWLDTGKMKIPWDFVTEGYLLPARDRETLPPTGNWSDGERHPRTGVVYRVYAEELKRFLISKHLVAAVMWNQPVPIIDHDALFAYFRLADEEEE